MVLTEEDRKAMNEALSGEYKPDPFKAVFREIFSQQENIDLPVPHPSVKCDRLLEAVERMRKAASNEAFSTRQETQDFQRARYRTHLLEVATLACIMLTQLDSPEEP